jgi:hypothetical protein
VWSRQAKIASTSDQEFGQAVALSDDGNTALVSAPGDTSEQGAAYVYVRAGTTWTQQAKLTADVRNNVDAYAFSIALEGDFALVGAPKRNSQRGAVYVYERTGTTWAQKTIITPADAANGDQFGSSLALVGDTVVIGAQGRSSNAGAVYVVQRSGAAWSQSAKLTLADFAANDYFGAAVAFDGTAIVVGAPGKGTPRTGGVAYVFTLSGPPAPPVEIMPSGFVPGSLTPSYTWSVVPGATLYAMRIYNFTTSTEVYFSPAFDAGTVCGPTTCMVTPSVPLSRNHDIYGWWAIAYSPPSGWGAWGTGKSFFVSVPPPAPIAQSPTANYVPDPQELQATFRFTQVAGGVQYAVALYNLETNTLVYFKVLDTIANPGACSAGVCSFKPTGADTTLVNGRLYGWFVAAVSYAGPGPWSNGLAFFLFNTPGVPTQVSPSGAVGSTPLYRWNALQGATAYNILVLNASGGVVLQQWVDKSTACATTPCQFAHPSGSPLSAGAYNWFVASGNPAGVSAYSSGLNIQVGAPPAAPTFVPPNR